MATDLSTGLKAYWRLDETTGTTLADALGLYNFSVTGNPSLNYEGKIGKATDFFNTANNATNASTGAFDGVTDKFSISLWVKPHSLPAGTDLYYFRTTHTATPWTSLAMYVPSGASNARFVIRDAAVGYQTTNTGNLTADTWQHIVFVINGVGTPGILYLNDVSTTGNNLAQNIYDHAGGFNIGNAYAGSGGGALAALDEIAIWNRALTGEEVTALYNGGAGFTLPFYVPPSPPAEHGKMYTNGGKLMIFNGKILIT